MAQITVVGCGVSGLTCALRLQEENHEITIISRDLPAETTSSAAGAVWYGYGTGKVRQWAQVSLQRFTQLIPVADSGVVEIRLREVSPSPLQVPWFKDELPFCERMPQADLPQGYADGYIMDVPLVEPPPYLQYLKTQFEQNGGRIVQRNLHSLDELATDNTMIINCSGLGARELAHDDHIFPIRGQTVRVDAPDIQQGFMDDDSFTYIFPRSDGVFLGGILQPNQDSLTIDASDTSDILQRCTKIEASIQQANILGYTVGLRPGRHAVRLETEQLTDSCTVIHNYGHAGLGFTLSWGCAEDVAELVGWLNITP
ncbi:MAG: FAD-dependent oxidoreductase [Anaerolineae bacterium]|nr:FAD-dependent oxidoreductase [Anaerolineae bacterium]